MTRAFFPFGFRQRLVGKDLGPAADHVQGRANFVGDPGGQPSDGTQPVGVSQVFHRRDASGRLLFRGFPGLRQLVAHGIDGRGQFAKFVVSFQLNRFGQVAMANPSRLFQQHAQRSADQFTAQQNDNRNPQQHGGGGQDQQAVDKQPHPRA